MTCCISPCSSSRIRRFRGIVRRTGAWPERAGHSLGAYGYRRASHNHGMVPVADRHQGSPHPYKGAGRAHDSSRGGAVSLSSSQGGPYLATEARAHAGPSKRRSRGSQ